MLKNFKLKPTVCVCFCYLFEFVQFGDVCYAGQADVDEAEQLQVRELFCDSFNLPFASATVIQNQLLDLRAGQEEFQMSVFIPI